MMTSDRRAFLRLTLGSVCVGMATDCSRAPGHRPAFVLEETSIDLIQRAMTEGALTARALCEEYLQRIATLNPTLHALIETNPDALTIADGLDRERRERGPRGPLHGIPLVVKDNIETADRMQTTAGSKVLDGVAVSTDAFVVERLRAAGAIILGKGNLTEWAGGGGRNGYSTRGGQTLNPYDPQRTPLGSSSGSGVTASANLAVAGLGTETMGSILAPSALLGVVGVKPTVGLISRTGIVPVALSMDTVGPMARNVTDAAHLLNVLAARDPEDTTTSARPAPVDYIKSLAADLKGVCIGIVREPSAGEESRALFDRGIEDLRTLGAILVDGVTLPEISESWFTQHLEVMFTEFKAQLPHYLAERRPRATVRTIADVIATSKRDGVQMPPLELAEQKGDISGAAYQRAFAQIRQISRAGGIDGAVRAHGLDALVSPAMGPAWTFAEEDKLDVFLPRGMLLTSDAGYPAVTLPMGSVNGLPVGILLFGTAWSDAVLLRCAYAYEQATHHRKPPTPRT